MRINLLNQIIIFVENFDSIMDQLQKSNPYNYNYICVTHFITNYYRSLLNRRWRNKYDEVV